MAKNNKSIILSQASTLDKASQFFRNLLANAPWINCLNDAANDIRLGSSNSDKEWAVNITDLEIPLREDPKHLQPQNSKGRLKLFVSINMKGDSARWKDCEDCILALNFKVLVKDDKGALCSGFHIDKVGPDEVSTEFHPLYHVHFINESQLGESQALSMDVPRLAHHPVDLLLGLLLVFANYDKEKYDELIADANCLGLFRESSLHILGPYYKSFSAIRWKEDLANSAYNKELCPFVIP